MSEIKPSHIITVDGWLFECTCSFRDVAGELSVRNHAATHEPPATVITEGATR